MRVAKLQEIISGYSRALKGEYGKQHSFWWDAIGHFQQHYNPDAPHFGSMLKQCFHSEVSRRLWKRDKTAPLYTLLVIGAADDNLLRSAFEELYNPHLPFEKRISRFDLCCESLLELYRNQHPTSTESFHQQDAQMISLYLCFRFPDQYSLYHPAAYRRILLEAESRNIPAHDDLPRYFSFGQTMVKLMARDEHWQQRHVSRLNPALNPQITNSLMPAVCDLLLWHSGLRF